MPAAILVVDDEPGVRDALVQMLEEAGYQVAAAGDLDEALAALQENPYELVISDLRMPGGDGGGGMGLLRELRKRYPDTLAVMMTAFATLETAIEALREGADDYMLKPVAYEEVTARVGRLLESRTVMRQLDEVQSQLDARFELKGVIGESDVMRRVLDRVSRVAPQTSTVLITGESGVGKEVIARAVHRLSKRADRLFLPVNCAAIPGELLESQLFGHERGAFTGAIARQEGLFQRSNGGTIFLDEIGELSTEMQVKLLRVLDQKEVMAVGADRPITIDARVIAATNRNLEAQVEARKFREDLFYRLNVFEIEIPPLRQRRSDIPLLAEYFVRQHNAEMKRSIRGVAIEAMRVLMAAEWRGNVRELDNAIEHAMIVANGERITADDLPPHLRSGHTDDARLSQEDLRAALQSFEREHIEAVLDQANSDKRVAADLLGISLSTLYRKLEEYGQSTT